MKKTNKIIIGILLVVAAVLIVVDALGVLAPISGFMGPVSLFRIVLGVILLYYIIIRLIKGRVASIFIPLALIFMLFEPNIAHMAGLEDPNIINNWIVLLSAVVLTVGFHLIFGTARSDSKHINANFGQTTEYIDSGDFNETKKVENNFGACNVYFSNAENYNGEGTLNLENNFVVTTVNVPSTWKVDVDVENNLGSTTRTGTGSENGPKLTITGENNLGNVRININDTNEQ